MRSFISNRFQIDEKLDNFCGNLEFDLQGNRVDNHVPIQTNKINRNLRSVFVSPGRSYKLNNKHNFTKIT